MKKFRRTLAVIALMGASVGVWEGGSLLLENVQFARAEQKVETSREQLQKVEDLSTVFRNVAQVIEPTVVQIEVHKTIKGVSRNSFGPGDDFLRRFFHDQGQVPPNEPNGEQGDNGGDTPDDSGPDMQEVGTGSGVIMQVDGSDAYIITNNHVAGGATDMTVTLSDGRTVKGKTIGADAKSDLAVVKISADHLIAAKWGNSEDLERGDWVLAFGSPFGYVGSMTHGIVSALDRHDTGILGKMGYEHFIQVDAPINPGNSGGPLVNIHGEVIGINTAIATRSGGFQGIGFAIPSAEAKTITAVLKDKGKVTRGWLGVSISDVDNHVVTPPALISQLGYSGEHGVFVQQVLRDTPSNGKLMPQDIIVQVDGKPVKNTLELRDRVAATIPGDELKLQVFRDGKLQDISVKIGEQPEDLESLASRDGGRNNRGAGAQTGQALGIRMSNITDELAQRNDLGDLREGALVTAVGPNSLAARSGLQPGDVITQIGDLKVANVQDATEALGKQDAKKGITLHVTNKEGSSILFLQKDN